jgi:predicted RNA-binding protein with PIN domain
VGIAVGSSAGCPVETMPVVIDGYNLLHAARGVEGGSQLGRRQLCEMAAAWSQKVGEAVLLVFDGATPSDALASQLHAEGVDVLYSGAVRSADEVIGEQIRASSAPRRLMVVSTDRAIRQAARRRRCRSATSAEFLELMVRVLSRPPRLPAEPPEKRKGTPPDEVDDWLRRFGFDPEEDAGQDPRF